MKPSSLSTWAMRVFVCVEGISTAGNSVRLALRTRVNMSAIGSVIMVGNPLCSPARLLDARNQPLVGHVAKADSADAELAIDRAGPAAQAAAQANLDPVARPQLLFGGVFLVRLDLLEIALELDTLRRSRH